MGEPWRQRKYSISERVVTPGGLSYNFLYLSIWIFTVNCYQACRWQVHPYPVQISNIPQSSGSNDPRYSVRIWHPFSIATFGRSLFSGGRYFGVAKMCIVYGPYEVSIIMISRQLENIHTFYLEKRISCYCFLNKCSKELFDDGVDIHRQNNNNNNKQQILLKIGK